MAKRITTGEIARQLREIRKDGKTDRRNTFIYWKTPSGQWRRKVAMPGTKSVNAKEPTGKYRGKKGVWYDARRGHKKTDPPFKFAPVVVPKRSKLSNVEGAIERIEQVFEEFTPDIWVSENLAPIEPRKAANPLGGIDGTVVGWRVRFRLTTLNGVSDTIHEEMAAAFEDLRDDKIVMRAFGGPISRAMIMYSARDSNGVEGTYTASAARVFQTALKQAASHLKYKAKNYPDWRLTGAFFYIQ
jgi:hypothetical protein